MTKQINTGIKISRKQTVFEPITVEIQLSDGYELSTFIESIKEWDDKLFKALTEMQGEQNGKN